MLLRRLTPAAALWMLFSAVHAQTAQDVCTIAHAGSAPPYTVHVEQQVQVGDALGSGWMMLAPIAWECLRTADAPTDLNVWPSITVTGSGIASGTSITHAGETYRRFGLNLNAEHIGYIARWRSVIHGQASDWKPVTEAVLQEDASAAPVPVHVANNATYTASMEIQVRTFKTHTASPGAHASLNFAPLQAALVTQRKQSASPMPDDVHPAQSPMLSVAFAHIHRACTTPDVDVQLPAVNTNTLPAVGSTGPAKHFEMRFEHCPAGLASIHYQFRSIPHQNIKNGVLPLLNTSTAAGVSVQVLDTNRDPLRFDVWHALTDYDPAKDAANYTVPLYARIIRTHQTVKAGRVRAAMDMTVQYQ